MTSFHMSVFEKRDAGADADAFSDCTPEGLLGSTCTISLQQTTPQNDVRTRRDARDGQATTHDSARRTARSCR